MKFAIIGSNFIVDLFMQLAQGCPDFTPQVT